ncbi:NDP-sugar synthase [Streptomyces sp. NPDC020747]|uniref:NDP-sugar synthase n=1 Tax=Streptomyces sp. NPDC020747 TaxID=3365086 RepID=UPI0037928FB7
MPELVAVIPAGGKGTRLAAVTGARPKSLAPVLEEPFVHLQLRHLCSLGFDRVHLCLGYGAEQILATVTEGTPEGLTVTHTIEPEPLGVIGAVRLALPELPPRFLMTYGDVLIPPAVDALLERHATNPCEATVLVTTASDESNIELGDGEMVTFYGKGNTHNSFVDIGLCALNSSCIAALPSDRPITELTLFTTLISRRGLAALPWPQKSLHIGDPEHLREVESWAAAMEVSGRANWPVQSRRSGIAESTTRSHAARTWRE